MGLGDHVDFLIPSFHQARVTRSDTISLRTLVGPRIRKDDFFMTDFIQTESNVERFRDVRGHAGAQITSPGTHELFRVDVHEMDLKHAVRGQLYSEIHLYSDIQKFGYSEIHIQRLIVRY